jgi:hypothetical protein
MAGFTGYDPERNSYVVEGNLVGNMSPEAFNQIVKNVTGQSFTGQQAPAQTQTQQAPVQAQAQAQQAPEESDAEKVYLKAGSGAKGIASIPGVKGKPELLYFSDDQGKSYVYDVGDGEYKTGAPPSGVEGLKLNSVISATGDSEDRNFHSTSIDPTEFQFGGFIDPKTSEKMAAEAARDPGYESGGGGLFYTYNDTEYYTPDNSGQGIPVGSTDITRDPGSKDITDPNNPEYSPVLSKGFTSYFDQNDPNEQAQFEQDVKPPAQDLTLGNVFSINPAGAVIDTGFKNPFGQGNIEFSNPPSQLQNLGPFFNLAESFGYQNFKDSYNTDVLAKMLGKPQPQPKTVGELIKDVGGTSVAPPSTTKDPDPGIGGDDGGGGGDDPDPDKDKLKRTTFFAPAKRSDPISTAPDEPINTDPRFQPIFPQQPIQPIEPPLTKPVDDFFTPQASPAMPQPAPIPIEAKPTVMPPPQAVPPVLPPQTFADVMAAGGTPNQTGVNPYFQAIEQINKTNPMLGIATNPMMLKDGGGIMSLRNRMLMAPASQAMTKGIMS